MLKEVSLEELESMELPEIVKIRLEDYKKLIVSGERIIFKIRIQKYVKYLQVYKYSRTSWRYLVYDIINM